ncbi:MAG: PfkB family carbohydrate kinase [Chloroflexota bacterium]
MAAPSFVVIGHVTKDLAEGEVALGGAVTYAALTAHGLGYRTRIITSAEPAVGEALAAALPGVAVTCLPSPRTTTFRNTYRHGRREQRLLAVAARLNAADIAPYCREADIALLAPVAGEIGPDLLDCFPDALLGLSPQGWLREWTDEGLVFPAPWRGDRAVLRRAVLVLSEEDVGEDSLVIADYAKHARVLVVTRGAQGATVYAGLSVHASPAFPAVAVDPTGAGDVFAAAFLAAYRETNDLAAAARFANCAASFAVAHPGIGGVPTRSQIEARLTNARQGRE